MRAMAWPGPRLVHAGDIHRGHVVTPSHRHDFGGEKTGAVSRKVPLGPSLGPRPRGRHEGATGAHQGGLPPRRLRRVCDYIEAHLGENMNNAKLASIAGLSMFHFVRAFRQSQGISPHKYVMRRRLERTMELLAGTDLPLAEIASAVGFSDQSHLSRRFRQHIGVTPRDYRWSMR